MKFGYSYKSSDGARHEKVFVAATKEEVFEALREQGIRPIKVWEMEGGKRGVARVLGWLAFVLGVFGAAIWAGLEVRSRSAAPGPQEEDRSQIYGDPGILQTCEARSWANVFEDEGDRFLARFAQPGRVVRLSSGQAWRGTIAAALKSNMKPVKVTRTDGPEIAKMKRMVNGMKAEMRQYVADGGTVEQYIDEVLERQKVEEGIVANFQVEFERLAKKVTKENRDETIEKWNAKNVLLREMGLKTVLLPEALED